MEEKKKILDKWLEDIASFHLPEWDALPEMDLYMDQVVSYMDKKMNPFHNDGDKILTPFMVNNYVKAHMIESPKAKKYNREHLAYLMTICSVKQVLSMNEISTLLSESRKVYEDCELLYEDYIKRMMDETMTQIATEFAQRLKKMEEETKDVEEGKNDFIRAKLASTAYRLSVEAQMKKTIADRIIALIDQDHQNEIQEAKKKKEVEEKKKKKGKK